MTLHDSVTVLELGGLLFILVYYFKTGSILAAKCLFYYCLLSLARIWGYAAPSIHLQR